MFKLLQSTKPLMLIAAFSAVLGAPSGGVHAGVHHELRGYYKNLYATTESAAEGRFHSDLNRLRLELDLSFNAALSAHVAYDNEIIVGSVLDTVEFMAARDAPENNFFDLSATALDNGGIFWRQSLYRAYVRYARKTVTLTAGRQRVPLGTGYIWSPEDLLDPISPLQIERDERAGTDALSLEVSTGPLSATTLAFAPGRSPGKESYFIRHRVNYKGYDISGLAGGFRQDALIGFDFSGYTGDSGLRGEFTYTIAKERGGFVRGVVGLDHTFPSTLYLSIEYLYNGGNDPAFTSTLGAATTSSEILTRNRNFLGVAAGYDITPLVRFEGLAVLDIDDKSAFLGPSVRYNIFEDLDLSAGMQVFTGKDASEYGGVPALYYGELQLYF